MRDKILLIYFLHPGYQIKPSRYHIIIWTSKSLVSSIFHDSPFVFQPPWKGDYSERKYSHVFVHRVLIAKTRTCLFNPAVLTPSSQKITKNINCWKIREKRYIRSEECKNIKIIAGTIDGRKIVIEMVNQLDFTGKL